MENKQYTLPELPYSYDALQPQISKEQLTLHHDKHHAAYVTGANTVLEKLEKARKENADVDQKAMLKELSFHVSGHILHTMFWQNMAPTGKGGGGVPNGKLADAINHNFGSMDRFKKEFSAAAVSVEGSGWAVLAYDNRSDRLLIMQVEKHQVNVIPNFKVLLVLDVWEHAYYVDYKNLRAKFVEAFWDIVNWAEVAKRYEEK